MLVRLDVPCGRWWYARSSAARGARIADVRGGGLESGRGELEGEGAEEVVGVDEADNVVKDEEEAVDVVLLSPRLPLSPLQLWGQ